MSGAPYDTLEEVIGLRGRTDDGLRGTLADFNPSPGPGPSPDPNLDPNPKPNPDPDPDPNQARSRTSA